MSVLPTQSAIISLTTPLGVIKYRLNRSHSRKKTMQVSILPPGEVVIAAPLKFTSRSIEDFLERKARWILDKVKIVQERYVDDIQARNSRGCLYLGAEYPITVHVVASPWGRILFDHNGWKVEVSQQKALINRNQYVLDFILKWFKSRAKIVLQERVIVYAKAMGVSPSEIHIRSPKGLWGSCHPVKRVLHFNWKIVMAPEAIMDYIVVHELCHIKVANHSKAFWEMVNVFCPEYKAHNRWLKDHGHRLKLPLKVCSED